ncbi:hypothetical protein [Streptomyces sp. AHA2]|uniref:hypothetical protein n=1 Tax=Streptomyces sp. AHA2 TaxID=3064526 RepID=UPI002FE1E3C1
MEQQQRYIFGDRDEKGLYPVTVDDIPAGTVHRRHGSWYATMPGHYLVKRYTDRHQAAAHLVTLIDQGIRPTGEAPTPRTPGDLIKSLRATSSYSHLVPPLRLSLANLVRAAEAMARLAELGWKPLEGYPGADQPWLMQCRLRGWQGRRFWSHLRGRNGDGIPRPITRHPGCKPVSEHAQALSDLAALRISTCPCPPFPRDKHPMDADTCLDILTSIQAALDDHAHMSALVHARSILEPCPAATRRATALRAAYERHAKAQQGLKADKRK